MSRPNSFYEMLAAFIILFVIIVGTLLQLTFFGADSWIFIIILNINILLLIVVIFLVSRNILKLVFERRRKVFGARLRTRLLFAFVAISLIPVIIMYLASNRVIVTNLDYWFTSQVENSMQSALEIGQSFYETYTDKLENTGDSIISNIKQNSLNLYSKQAEDYLMQQQVSKNLDLIGIVTKDLEEIQWHARSRFMPIWFEAKESIFLGENSGDFNSLLISNSSGDYIITYQKFDENLYLLLAENIGKGILMRMESISQGFNEYSYLKNLKRPLKLSFSLILGLLGITMFFGAVWVAFRLSKELTAPIQALQEGALHLAKGDDYVFTDKGRDELSELVDSFNYMAEEISQSRQKLTNANQLLELRNITVQLRNKYIETVLDNIATGVVTLAKKADKINMQILTINKAACRIFGVESRQVEGRNPNIFLRGEFQAQYNSILEYLNQNPDKAYTKEIDMPLKSNTVKLLVHAIALPESDLEESEGSFVFVFEDITELSKMQRQSAWAEVAKKIAHEIKNPLTPIQLCAQRLEKKFSAQITDPAFLESTRLIISQSDRLLNMVNEFSTFARLPEVKLIPQNLVKLLEELFNFVKPTYPNIEWCFENKLEEPAIILMDYNALYGAILNIFNNAIEAAGKNPKIELCIAKEAKEYILTISDNGKGINPKDLDKIFEPYFSSKKTGTGLGLAIVQSTIEKHNATICAQTRENTGLIFTIKFEEYIN